jgi:hypothetical protein
MPTESYRLASLNSSAIRLISAAASFLAAAFFKPRRPTARLTARRTTARLTPDVLQRTYRPTSYSASHRPTNYRSLDCPTSRRSHGAASCCALHPPTDPAADRPTDARRQRTYATRGARLTLKSPSLRITIIVLRPVKNRHS